jgi:hypothetical protein
MDNKGEHNGQTSTGKKRPRGYLGHSAFPDVPYDQQSVKHTDGEYVNGQAHTNGIESFGSMLKRGYKVTYHEMSLKHLERYVTEFAGRHNVCGLDTLAQMAALVRGMDGRRLRYDDLVGKP